MRPVELRYAENIKIEAFDGGHVVRMKNPWRKGEWLHTYLLVNRDDSAKVAHEGLPVAGTVVYVPLARSVIFNTAHASLLCMLLERSSSAREMPVAGVADLKYMQLPEIHRMVGEGRIADCGNSMAPDMERIIDLQADAILLSPFENNGGYGGLEDIGVPIVECADYMETSALGRAEWMLFYGMLYGLSDEAEALFSEVESQYHSLSEKARTLPERRSILTEKMTGNTWYVAGGKSSVGQLIADAGGSYAWSADTHSGSIALPFETVLDQAGETDVWVFNETNPHPTYPHLAAEYHGYRQLKAFREHQVWYVNSMSVPYFEEVSFRPDWLLRDYVVLLHPSLRRELGMPKYYKPLDE